MLIQDYISYVKNNPNKYWFKRKIYGWGWTPVRWQGWVVSLLYVAIIVGLALTLDENSSTKQIIFTLILPIVILTIIFMRICFKKGDKPKWQWGFPKEKDL